MTMFKILIPVISATVTGIGACILKIRASKKEGKDNLERHLEIVKDLQDVESEIEKLENEISDSTGPCELYIERVDYIIDYLDLIETKVTTRSIVFDMDVELMDKIIERVERNLEICDDLKTQFYASI